MSRRTVIPAVILIDQLKDIHVDGTLNPIDTTQWYPTVMRKDYALAFTVTETGLDDPDQMFTRTICADRSAITPATATPRPTS